MPLPFYSRIRLSVCVIIGLLGLISVLAYRQTLTFTNDVRWVTYSHAVQSRTATLLALLAHMESGQRGYVITGDGQYLTFYEKDQQRLKAVLQEMQTLTADNPDQQRRLQSLIPVITKKLDHMKTTISLRQMAGVSPALERVRANTGKHLMDHIQQILGAINEEEETILQHREARANVSTTRMRSTILLSSILAAFVAVSALWLIRRELTARAQAEHLLRQSEAQFRSLADSSPVGIFLTDAVGQTRYTNERWQYIHDLTLAESLREGWSQTIHPAERAAVFASWREDAQAGREYVREFRILTRQGEVRWEKGRSKPILDEQGAVSGHVGTSVDVTAQKHAELTLQASEERYRMLFESAADGILVSTAAGVITDCNAGLETMLGWSREELRGKHVQTLVPPRWVPTIETYMQERIAGSPCPVIESELLRKDGSPLPVESLLTCLWDDEHRVSGFQMVHRDISARKALEHQRNEFLAMLIHDIKNPLGVILGYGEMLRDAAASRKATADVELVQQLQSQAVLIHALVTNYLELSRVESGSLQLQTQPLLLNELLEQVWRRYHMAAQQHHVTFTLQVPNTSPVVEGDLYALTRIFSNLVSNALKFTPVGGWITLTAEHRNTEAVGTVTDSGIGIAPEDLASVFDKYQRSASSHYEGTGLGLFIVKTFVSEHKGCVSVKNRPEGGAQFTVVLPTTIRDTEKTMDAVHC